MIQDVPEPQHVQHQLFWSALLNNPLKTNNQAGTLHKCVALHLLQKDNRNLDRPRPVHLDPDRPVLDRRFKRITYEKKQKLMNVVFAIGSN